MPLYHLYIYLPMIADVPLLLLHVDSHGLQQLVPGNELALKMHHSKRLNSFNDTCTVCLNVNNTACGKPGWFINRKNFIFYPANLLIILPGPERYAEKEYPGTGLLYRVHLHLNNQQAGSKSASGKWSKITPYLQSIWALIWNTIANGLPGLNIKQERQHFYQVIYMGCT